MIPKCSIPLLCTEEDNYGGVGPKFAKASGKIMEYFVPQMTC